MTASVDTNILLDILIPDPDWMQSSSEAIAEAVDRDGAIVGETVVAELSARFDSAAKTGAFLADLGVTYVASSAEALHRSGIAWRQYARRRPKAVACPHCGKPAENRCARCGALLTARQHLLPDFLVGAHALVHADRLLTRDLGIYRTYFPELKLS